MRPYVGQIVLWFEGGVRDYDRACPAIVLSIHYGSVFLLVHGSDRDFRLEGVRHMDDATTRESDRISEGGWDFCLCDKAVQVPLSEQRNLKRNVTTVKNGEV